MKVSTIRAYSRMNFTGEKSKSNAVKTAAGAAAIALATAVPAQEAEAQIFYPQVPYNHYYYVPTPVVNVPNCFVYGDMDNFEYDKSMNQVFSEIDNMVDENRELSVNEVVKMERKNWNMNSIYPYNSAQMERTAAQFRNLSEIYNERGSNPKTISYSEYKTIMKDYMKSKNVTDFLMLMHLFTRPRRPCPIHGPHVPPPPPHHHHHHHR